MIESVLVFTVICFLWHGGRALVARFARRLDAWKGNPDAAGSPVRKP